MNKFNIAKSGLIIWSVWTILFFSWDASANTVLPDNFINYLKTENPAEMTEGRIKNVILKEAVIYDLNQDGKDEYIVFGNSCGTGGCSFGIFQKSGNSYKDIMSFDMPEIYQTFKLKILKTRHNGWLDMQIWVTNDKDNNYSGSRLLIYQKDGFYHKKKKQDTGKF